MENSVENTLISVVGGFYKVNNINKSRCSCFAWCLVWLAFI